MYPSFIPYPSSVQQASRFVDHMNCACMLLLMVSGSQLWALLDLFLTFCSSCTSLEEDGVLLTREPLPLWLREYG